MIEYSLLLCIDTKGHILYETQASDTFTRHCHQRVKCKLASINSRQQRGVYQKKL